MKENFRDGFIMLTRKDQGDAEEELRLAPCLGLVSSSLLYRIHEELATFFFRMSLMGNMPTEEVPLLTLLMFFNDFWSELKGKETNKT